MWDRAKIFLTQKEALQEAAAQLDDTDICEYGICFIDIDREFSPDDLSKFVPLDDFINPALAKAIKDRKVLLIKSPPWICMHCRKSIETLVVTKEKVTATCVCGEGIVAFN